MHYIYTSFILDFVSTYMQLDDRTSKNRKNKFEHLDLVVVLSEDVVYQ